MHLPFYRGKKKTKLYIISKVFQPDILVHWLISVGSGLNPNRYKTQRTVHSESPKSMPSIHPLLSVLARVQVQWQ